MFSVFTHKSTACKNTILTRSKIPITDLNKADLTHKLKKLFREKTKHGTKTQEQEKLNPRVGNN